MFITMGIFPDKIKVLDDKDTTTHWKVTVVVDEDTNIHLTLEQARSLWHELGAVLAELLELAASGKHSAYLDGKCVCGHLQSEHDDEPGSSHACMVPALSRGDFGCHCPSFKRDSLAVHYA